MPYRDTHIDKGAGLARGPALIMGAILSAFGLILFLKAGDTPTNTFPDGTQNGLTFLGFEINGWTAWFTTTAGALLLFGAAQHLLAKTMSLLVGLALGACAVIALIDGNDVLGLAAANGWTELGWAIAAAILLVNTLLPRVKKERLDDDSYSRTGAAPVKTRPVESARPVESTRPLESERPVASTRPVEPEHPAEATRPGDTVRTGRAETTPGGARPVDGSAPVDDPRVQGRR